MARIAIVNDLIRAGPESKLKVDRYIAEIELNRKAILVYIVCMCAAKKISRYLALFAELWAFIRFRKRYWLLPILIFLFLLSLFIVLVEGSAVAPFIYTLF